MSVLIMRSLWIHLKWPLCACKEWAHSRLVAQFWGYSALHSFLRSTGLTGNQRSAFPRAASMWCWAAWSGIQSTRFWWWQRISRASPSLASSPSEHPQSPLLSQVLFPSAHPPHTHTHQPHCIKASTVTWKALFKPRGLSGLTWISCVRLLLDEGVHITTSYL